MSLTPVSYFFTNVNTGGYDINGQWYSPSTDLVTDNGVVTELVFYAFNSLAIHNVESGLTGATVTVSYTLKSASPASQNIGASAFYLNSDAQSQVDADKTDSTASTFSHNATVFNNLKGTSSNTVSVKNQSVAAQLDVTTAVNNAYAYGIASGSAGGRSGTGLPTTIPETYVSFTPATEQSGLTYVSDVLLTVNGYVASGVPTISGTVSNQSIYAGAPIKPFSRVVLTDPGNPSGAGDAISITVLANYGTGTSDSGVLSGTGLTSYGDGSYTLAAAASLADLQRELNSLVFTVTNSFQARFEAPLTLELDYQAADYNTVDNQSTTLVYADSASQVACYTRGTLLLTSGGEVPVESLSIDDLVVTASGEHRPIHWVGRRSYAGRFLLANPGVTPIRFRAGSLGNGLPRRDLLVSPDHAMFLDGVLVPARCLANGSTIVQEPAAERVDYFHIELESHDVLLAEGAASESFLDDDSRGMFHNALEYAALHSSASGPGRFCALRVEHGMQLELIRTRLECIAGLGAQAA